MFVHVLQCVRKAEFTPIQILVLLQDLAQLAGIARLWRKLLSLLLELAEGAQLLLFAKCLCESFAKATLYFLRGHFLRNCRSATEAFHAPVNEREDVADGSIGQRVLELQAYDTFFDLLLAQDLQSRLLLLLNKLCGDDIPLVLLLLEENFGR